MASLPSLQFVSETGETSVQLFLALPLSGYEFPLRLQRRAQPLLVGSYASWGQDRGGALLKGRNPERSAPHRGSPAPVPSLGSRQLSSVGLSPIPCPLSHGSSPKTESWSWRAPLPSVPSLGQVRKKGQFWFRGQTHREALAPPLKFPPLVTPQLAALASETSCLPGALRPGPAARQRPLACLPGIVARGRAGVTSTLFSAPLCPPLARTQGLQLSPTPVFGASAPLAWSEVPPAP